LSYPLWLPNLLRRCIVCACEEGDCKVVVSGPEGAFFIIKIDKCLSKYEPELLGKPICDCAIVCEDLICLVEIKCGKVRPGDFENGIKSQLDEVEGFFRKHGFSGRRFIRIVAIRSYGTHTLRWMVSRRLLHKRIGADILTPRRNSLTLRAGEGLIILRFIS